MGKQNNCLKLISQEGNSLIKDCFLTNEKYLYYPFFYMYCLLFVIIKEYIPCKDYTQDYLLSFYVLESKPCVAATLLERCKISFVRGITLPFLTAWSNSNCIAFKSGCVNNAPVLLYVLLLNVDIISSVRANSACHLSYPTGISFSVRNVSSRSFGNSPRTADVFLLLYLTIPFD